jgi:UDP-N-acetylmuramoyl-tripeptide--D-alanyl-D-alanine ligase
MNRVVAAGALVASMVSLVRWLRVSQREHYLPWSVVASARRWLSRRPPNVAIASAWAVLAVVTLLPIGDAAVLSGLAAAVVGAAWPLGMSILGSPRLRFTRRAAMLGVVSMAIAAIGVVVLAILLGLKTAGALAPAVAAIAVDVGVLANAPIERRIVQRFRRAADEKLRRVRPRVVAITGSYGKTTVKNHVRDLVGAALDTVATPASWNNLAGLSRAINEHLTPGTEVFVAEMGTYGPGEIRDMVSWVRPEVAVITAIAPVHLERMGSLEAILDAKAEIVDGVRSVVLGADSTLLRRFAGELRNLSPTVEVWLAGTHAAGDDVDVVVSERCREHSADASELVVHVRGEELGAVARGSLHPTNVACSVAAALALGADPRAVRSALDRLTSPPHRSLVATTDAGVVVIDDTFNSNPDGARAAIATLQRHAPDGRRFVVTPGMVEMGHEQFSANHDLAEAVAASGAELVVVGWTNRDALLSGFPNATTVRNRQAARSWLSARLRAGDGVLWENDLPDHYP